MAEGDLQKLLESGDFSEAQLAEWRAAAVSHGGGAPPPPGVQHVLLAIGWVEIWEHRANNSTYYELMVDGRELRLPSRKLYEALTNHAAYRVYFKAKDVLGIEPAAPEEVPDAVAEAARAVGLDPGDPAVRTDERVAGILRTQLIVALGRAEEFSGEDLAVNRAGRLTAREQKALRGKSLGCFTAAVFVSAFATLFAAAVFQEGASCFTITGTIVGFAVVIGLVVAGIRRRRDAAAGRVVSVIATVSGDKSLQADGDRSFLVERSSFSIRGFHPAQLRALSYRVYAAPRSDELMSVEPGPDLSPLFAAR